MSVRVCLSVEDERGQGNCSPGTGVECRRRWREEDVRSDDGYGEDGE